MSAARVQMIAANAVVDHEHSPQLLLDLAALGTSGRHPSHIHNQLVALTKARCPETPEIIGFQLPMKYRRFRAIPGVDVEASHGMHAPFAWLSNIFRHTPNKFRDRFLGGQDCEIGDIL